jgi:hypothetical protein
MAARSRWIAVTGLFTVALIAFFTGRGVEERALAANAHTKPSPSAASPTAVAPALPSYRQLAVAEILGLPFADFYEALRSAPGEAREKWASELVAMPKGPRRTAAVSGFYKLLVQFDPTAAVKAIREIEDVGVQSVALGSAANAAPGFAMQEMAELSLSLEGPTLTASKRDYLSDVLLEWMLIDPAAVAQFIDDHPEAENYENFRERLFLDQQLISPLAALDPKAAREWIDRKGKWEYWEIREAFIEGWYENDGAAAVSYVLAHVEDLGQDVEIRAIVRGLYLDSKEEAAKFIQDLPEDKRQQALSGAFRNFVLGVEEETGDTVLTQRAVASWMIEFPPAYWKGALSQLFGPTRKGDDDMLSWIEQLPPALHEAVAAEYTPPYWKSTSEAIMGVLQVADPRLRDQLLRATLQSEYPALDEARAAIANAPLSSEQKNYVLQMIVAVEAEKDHD